MITLGAALIVSIFTLLLLFGLVFGKHRSAHLLWLSLIIFILSFALDAYVEKRQGILIVSLLILTGFSIFGLLSIIWGWVDDYGEDSEGTWVKYPVSQGEGGLVELVFCWVITAIMLYSAIEISDLTTNIYKIEIPF